MQFNSYRWTLTLTTLTSVFALAACSGGKPSVSTQSVAKVNKEEITVHQIDYVLRQQPGLLPSQLESASREALERLVDQELVVQQAMEQRLDREPRVLQMMEAAKRDILVQAYVQKVADTAGRPTTDEISQYYTGHPDLFAKRRIYNLQEFDIQAPAQQALDLRARLENAKNPAALVNELKDKGLVVVGTQALRSAEQLPPEGLAALSKLQDGQSFVEATATGLRLVLLESSKSAPVTEAQARPHIEQYLLNQGKTALLKRHAQELRSNAKIDYLGKFAATQAAAGPRLGASAPLSN